MKSEKWKLELNRLVQNFGDFFIIPQWTSLPASARYYIIFTEALHYPLHYLLHHLYIIFYIIFSKALHYILHYILQKYFIIGGKMVDNYLFWATIEKSEEV